MTRRLLLFDCGNSYLNTDRQTDRQDHFTSSTLMFSLALVSNTRTPTESPNCIASVVSTCFLDGSSFLFPTGTGNRKLMDFQSFEVELSRTSDPERMFLRNFSQNLASELNQFRFLSQPSSLTQVTVYCNTDQNSGDGGSLKN